MRWVRRRRRNVGPFYINFKWFVVPTSWGIHVGPETYNVTKRRSWFRLPFGLGDVVSGGRSRRGGRR